jgi:hypothetical protein
MGFPFCHCHNMRLDAQILDADLSSAFGDEPIDLCFAAQTQVKDKYATHLNRETELQGLKPN